MEVFLKRAERPFKNKLGEEKTRTAFNDIKKAINEIPAKFRRTIGSEIPKFLFTFSQDIESLSSEITAGVLDHILIFAESLKELINKDRNQVSQLLVKRSDNKTRNLADLLNLFVEKAMSQELMNKSGGFEDILSYLFGDKAEVDQLSEIELFIKRAEKNFSLIFGKFKAQEYSDKIKNELKKVDPNFQEYLNSEIPKYLFKLSQNVENYSNETLEKTTSSILVFINAVSDMSGKNREEINQLIVSRSKNKLFNLMDLFNAFLKEMRERKEPEMH